MGKGIAIIIPIYNTELYLHRCLNSVLSQTFKDFCLILVNDGSTDSSLAICEEYASKDNRVFIINQTNKGAASARNTGLDWVISHSDYQWIAFIDSDDWIDPNYLLWQMKAIEDNSADLCQCGVIDVNDDTVIPEIQSVMSRVITAEEADLMIGAVAPTRKIYARHLFDNIRYPEGTLFEDEYVTYRLFFKAQRIVYVDAPLYRYYVRPGSLMHSKWNPKYLDAFEAYRQQIAFFDEKGSVACEKRSVTNFVNVIISQFHNARKVGAKAELKIMRQEMSKLLGKYGSKGKKWLTFKEYQGAYEVVYPHLMWLYWATKGKLRKYLRINKG